MIRVPRYAIGVGVQVKNLKVCGITSSATAQYCAAIGVGAVGAVFYPSSPRNLTASRAREIFAELPQEVARVGVFVGREVSEVLEIAWEARLTTLQLHGGESVASAVALAEHGYRVIKVFKEAGEELQRAVAALPESIGVMVECSSGVLPGGNGRVWDWAAAAPLAQHRNYAVAGGLTPQNVVEAMRLSVATACDLSSGVEDAPGIKSHAAIATVVQLLRRAELAVGGGSFWR